MRIVKTSFRHESVQRGYTIRQINLPGKVSFETDFEGLSSYKIRFMSEEEKGALPQRRVVRPKSVAVKIEGWANRRTLIIDRKRGLSYLGLTAESTGCHRCKICETRLRRFMYHNNFTFHTFPGYESLFIQLKFIPTKDMDLSVVRKGLKVLVEEIYGYEW